MNSLSLNFTGCNCPQCSGKAPLSSLLKSSAGRVHSSDCTCIKCSPATDVFERSTSPKTETSGLFPDVTQKNCANSYQNPFSVTEMIDEAPVRFSEMSDEEVDTEISKMLAGGIDEKELEEKSKALIKEYDKDGILEGLVEKLGLNKICGFIRGSENKLLSEHIDTLTPDELDVLLQASDMYSQMNPPQLCGFRDMSLGYHQG